MRWTPLILLLGGCDLLFGEIDDTWEPEVIETDDGTNGSGCPSGLAEPTSIDVSVRSLTINGNNYSATLATEPYDDTPVACVSDDGLQAQVLLAVSGEPFAWVRSYAAASGSQNLISGTGAEIVALDFAPTITWSDGDWSSGRWSVTGVAGTWTHSLSANAASGTNLLNTELYIEVTP